MPAISKILISNRGLTKLGCARITSFTDGSKAAMILKETYDELRDEVNEAHPWKFSREEATLNVLAASANPSTVYSFAFQLPVDCLRVRETNLTTEEEWSRHSDSLLLANSNAVKIVYTKQITDEGAFSKHFCETLACRIAYELAYSLTGKKDLADTWFGIYEKYLALARSFDSQGGGKPKLILPNTWTSARR